MAKKTKIDVAAQSDAKQMPPITVEHEDAPVPVDRCEECGRPSNNHRRTCSRFKR